MKYKRERNFRNTKYPREKILDPRNTHEEKFCTHEILMGKKIWAHEIPTKINFGPTKWQKKKKKDWTQEITTRKIFGPQKARWDGGTTPSMALDWRNSAYPYQKAYWMLFKKHANESTVYFYRI